MSDRYSEAEALAAIPRLTRSRLVTYIEAQVVTPVLSEGGHVYRQVDIARLALLCDLTEDLELDETGAAVVISLIDQLHAARQDLRALARALEAEPPEVRARIGAALRGAR